MVPWMTAEARSNFPARCLMRKQMAESLAFVSVQGQIADESYALIRILVQKTPTTCYCLISPEGFCFNFEENHRGHYLTVSG